MKFFKMIFFLMLTQALFAGRMEINAESMKTENQEVHFIGNVKIKMDESWLHADSVTVYLDENKKTQMYEAEGFVQFEFKEKKKFFKGHADNVTYNMLTLMYVLKGKAEIHDNNLMIKRRLKGDKITLNMFTGRVKVKGASLDSKVLIKLHTFGRKFGF